MYTSKIDKLSLDGNLRRTEGTDRGAEASNIDKSKLCRCNSCLNTISYCGALLVCVSVSVCLCVTVRSACCRFLRSMYIAV